MPTMTSSPCRRIKNCLLSGNVTQSAKAIFWLIGSIPALFIPVPFVNGALQGGMLFMGVHELAQHPSSVCMDGTCRSIALTRTWKHIATGAAISGIGWGLGIFSISTNIPILAGVGLAGGCLGGMAFGFRVAYSNVCFFPKFSRTLLPLNEEEQI